MKYKKIILDLLKIFLTEQSVDKIKYFYYKLFMKSYFWMSFKKNYFEVKFDNGLILKSKNNPLPILMYPLEGYIRYYQPKKGDCIIDAGAYDGVLSIYFSMMVGNTGKVVAFEPDKKNFKDLLENIKLNNVDNIITINKGLWNKNEYLEFFRCDNDPNSIIVQLIDNETKGNIDKCEVVRLDDELKMLRINKVDFIKMDIEGAELEAIGGCKELLKKNKVFLAIASYHTVNGEKTYKKLEYILGDMDYETKTEYMEHLTTYAFKKDYLIPKSGE